MGLPSARRRRDSGRGIWSSSSWHQMGVSGHAGGVDWPGRARTLPVGAVAAAKKAAAKGRVGVGREGLRSAPQQTWQQQQQQRRPRPRQQQPEPAAVRAQRPRQRHRPRPQRRASSDNGRCGTDLGRMGGWSWRGGTGQTPTGEDDRGRSPTMGREMTGVRAGAKLEGRCATRPYPANFSISIAGQSPWPASPSTEHGSAIVVLTAARRPPGHFWRVPVAFFRARVGPST
jgi:hypothetical protein